MSGLLLSGQQSTDEGHVRVGGDTLIQKSFLLARCFFFTGGSQYHCASRKISEAPTRKPPV